MVIMEDKNKENINEERKYCVYIHTSPSGKKYVGQTGQDPARRWGKNGDNYLRKRDGEYCHRAFAHAILKYGWDNFKHEIIEDALTKEEADDLEKLLIENLNTKDSKYGYNLKDGGIGGGGFSEETLRKMSESHKGIKQSEETIRKRFENLRGENHFQYGIPLSKEVKKKISDSKKGDKHHMYGKHMSEETKEKLKKSQKARKIAQYDLYGNLIKIWDSMGDAARESNIHKTNISACCRKKAKTAGGFVWEYYKDENSLNNETYLYSNAKKPVAQYSLSGELICIFNSIGDAESKTGVWRSRIRACCKDNNKVAGGFVWKYYDEIEEAI